MRDDSVSTKHQHRISPQLCAGIILMGIKRLESLPSLQMLVRNVRVYLIFVDGLIHENCLHKKI